tara:strand:- start:5 stop:196 length:192 start_codon:yes stop_codon:yes gene_type:complete
VIALFIISIGIDITFDIKIDLFKGNSNLLNFELWQVQKVNFINANANQIYIKNKKHPAANPHI